VLAISMHLQSRGKRSYNLLYTDSIIDRRIYVLSTDSAYSLLNSVRFCWMRRESFEFFGLFL